MYIKGAWYVYVFIIILYTHRNVEFCARRYIIQQHRRRRRRRRDFTARTLLYLYIREITNYTDTYA